MTAETLKPFIAPTSAVNHFPAKPAHVTHSQRKPRQLIAIILGVIGLVLIAGILTLTIWQTIRVRQLDSDLGALRREVESLRQRLGINYLEDIAEFQKEYTNLLIHDPSKLDDLEAEDEDEDDDDDDDNDNDDDDDGDDDDNDGGENEGDTEDDALTWLETDDDDEDALGNARLDYSDYLDMVKKEQEDSRSTEKEDVDEMASTATTSTTSPSSASSASNDDNVFDDFTSYNDSKKKRERKSRSIDEMRNELQSNDLAQNRSNDSRTDEKPKARTATSGDDSVHHKRVHRLNPRRRHSRKRLLVRKVKSSGSHSPPSISSTPAAHFHLNGKVPPHKAMKVHSYDGDMYMAQPGATGNNHWQQHFIIENGVLTVQQQGLYYVYGQVCYNNTHDHNGFIIFHGEHPLLQCLNTVPTSTPHKVHTCHTSGLIHLQEKDSIHLRDIHQDRNVILRNGNNRSFFGIIKI